MEESVKIEKLGNIVDVKGGKRLPKGISLISTPNNHPYIRIRDLGASKILELNSAYEYVDDETQKTIARYIVSSGDILISIVGTIGLVGIVGDSLHGANQTENCVKLVNLKGIDRDYLYYFLSSNLGQNEIKRGIVGAVQSKLPIKNIENINIPLPSLALQKSIASILSSLDSKIELNRRINDNLEQQAQALFKSWFVDFEPFNGEKPSNWSYCKIKNLHHIIETGKRPKGGVAHIKQGIPSIGAESIKGIGYYDYSKTKYISNEFASSLKKGKIHDYDLLIYKDGGKPGYFIPNFSIMGEGFPFDTMYLNEHVFRLDLGSSGMNIFAYFYFQTDEIINMLESVGGKAAIPGINQQNIEDLEILSPDIDYVQRYGELVYPIFKSILQNCRENAKLEKIRDALLPRLMSGELKIYDLNC